MQKKYCKENFKLQAIPQHKTVILFLTKYDGAIKAPAKIAQTCDKTNIFPLLICENNINKIKYLYL